MILTIIVTFNASSWIDKCIGSLLNSTIPVDIIVIDNCSTDGTREIIKSRYPSVRLIVSNENLGFGEANNIGLKIALDEDYEYVFLLNQDGWVEPDSLEKMINISKKYAEFGIISPIHFNGNGKGLDYGFINYLRREADVIIISDLFLKGVNGLNEVYKIGFVNAAFWLLPIRTLEKVGGFNPLFFLYGEDRDFVNRCIYHGFEVGYVPGAKAYHDRPQYDNSTKADILSKTIPLVKILNPLDNFTVGKHIKRLIKISIRNLFLLQFPHLKANLSELGFFIKYFKEIKKISQKVLSIGPTFLR